MAIIGFLLKCVQNETLTYSERKLFIAVTIRNLSETMPKIIKYEFIIIIWLPFKIIKKTTFYQKCEGFSKKWAP